jgi:pimeloyl-ACP methyl ester carboxylesterase
MGMLLALVLAASLVQIASAGDPAPQPVDPSLLTPHRVDVEPGRRLNIRCVGSGSPTIVFEQGGDGMIFDWAKVLPAVGALTRLCVYDRGGFGWSDPPRYPVTALSVTDDLHALLPRAGVRGPIILVGHSVGGFYATMYADRFLGDVAGLVLVDPGFSGQNPDWSPDARIRQQADMRRGEANLLRCSELARTGKLTDANLAASRCYAVPASVTTPAERRYALNAVTRPYWYLAEQSQSTNYASGDAALSVSQQQERDAARSFGDLPLIVLSDERFATDPWRTPAETAIAAQDWREGHAALARRSSRGRMEVVQGAGHFIQRDRPEAVISAIQEVLIAARSKVIVAPTRHDTAARRATEIGR